MNRTFQGELFNKLYIRNSIALHTYTSSHCKCIQKLIYIKNLFIHSGLINMYVFGFKSTKPWKKAMMH